MLSLSFKFTFWRAVIFTISHNHANPPVGVHTSVCGPRRYRFIEIKETLYGVSQKRMGRRPRVATLRRIYYYKANIGVVGWPLLAALLWFPTWMGPEMGRMHSVMASPPPPVTAS